MKSSNIQEASKKIGERTKEDYSRLKKCYVQFRLNVKLKFTIVSCQTN